MTPKVPSPAVFSTAAPPFPERPLPDRLGFAGSRLRASLERAGRLLGSEAVQAWLFLLPALAILATFVAWPAAYSFYLSLHDWDLMSPARRFAGWANYARLARDGQFWTAAAHTLEYALLTVPANMALGLGLALALHRTRRLRTVLRTSYFSPVVTSTVAASAVWMWIYHPEVGLLNDLLHRVFGTGPIPWLADPRWAMPAVALMSVWRSAGYTMVLFLAGLQGVPRELQEAARIDGAGSWGVFRHVTWPMLSPVTLFVFIISIIDSLQVFTQVHVMTQGGPAGATEVVVYYLYYRAFELFQMGYASAVAYVLFAAIVALTVWQLRLSGRWVFKG
ncbi:MAG: sugar ABC transporter permease [Limnochordaceae bacterium]|nr:sugar ABC transporter permease [Limnochordaceae bacterium]